LQITGRRSEFDAGSDDTIQPIGTRLSSHSEVSTHDRGFGGSEEILSAHLAEALQYRPKLMMG